LTGAVSERGFIAASVRASAATSLRIVGFKGEDMAAQRPVSAIVPLGSPDPLPLARGQDRRKRATL
jgi:hypothetical protein